MLGDDNDEMKHETVKSRVDGIVDEVMAGSLN